MPINRSRLRRPAVILTATAAGCVVLTLLVLAVLRWQQPDDTPGYGATAGGTERPSQHRSPRPKPKPLSGALAKHRAAQARSLYGGSDIRPWRKRKTSIVALGDSEISGEGTKDYTDGTDGPRNFCHRSEKSAIHHTGMHVDASYNLACSGAVLDNIRSGGTRQYPGELAQADSLAIKARNTRVTTVVLLAGANDDLNFGTVMSDCVRRRMLLRGPCHTKYGPGWKKRVDTLVPKISDTLTNLRTVMRRAGYRKDDYRLVLLSYPSPIGPEGRSDGPSFALEDGCLTYPEDGTWARDTAVTTLARGLRRAADRAGTRFLDVSALFHGHEACTDHSWVRGLTLSEKGSAKPAQGSFHPNAAGHRALGRCLGRFRATDLRRASCTAPGGGGKPVLTADDG